MVAFDRIPNYSADSSSADALCLVSQGGGIGGGAYVVGVMKALREMNVLGQITKTYLSSAAVPAVLYPLMSKDRLVEDIWIHEVTKPEVIDIRRVLSDRPILDIDYLVDEIMTKYPFSAETFSKHQVAMYFSVAVLNRESHRLDHEYLQNTDSYPALEMIRASLAIPLLYGKTVQLGEHEYLDGGIIRQTPFPETVPEKMIVILTDHVGKIRSSGYGERALLQRYPAQTKIEQEIAKAVVGRHAIAAKEYERLQRRQQRGDQIVLLQPTKPIEADIICNKPKLVEATIRQGYQETYQHERELEAICLQRAA